MFDIIIKGGSIVDGGGGEAYISDVGIRNDRIAAICDLSSASAGKIVDAGGLYVTPGFIDAHSHADGSAPMWPDMESALGQGVTTCVTGHCGLSAAPVNNYWMEIGFEEPAFNRIFPQYPGGPRPGSGRVLAVNVLAPAFERAFGTPLDWRGMGEYLDHLDRCLGVNMVCHTGHSQLRQQVLGPDAARPATEEELKEIGALLKQSLDDGAWGLSLGLDYYSSGSASRDELLYLMKIVKEYGRIVTAHVQSRVRRRGKVDPRFTYGEGLVEFLELGKESGAIIHISHLKPVAEIPGSGSGIDLINKRSAEAAISVVKHYRDQGLRVTWDRLCGPLVPCFYYPQLVYRFRPYTDECGGPEGFAAALGSRWYRQELSKDINNGNHRGKDGFGYFNPETSPALLCIKAINQDYVGKTLSEIAGSGDVLETAFDILAADPYAMFHRKPVFSLETGRVFAEEEDVSFGTDNGAFNYDYRQEDGPGMVSRSTPSAYCQMITYLENDYGLSFGQMIRRLSGNAAQSYNIHDRGFVREGYYADLLVLDKKNLHSNYSLTEPRTMPSGIDCVIVNGKMALEKEIFHRPRSGKTIRAR